MEEIGLKIKLVNTDAKKLFRKDTDPTICQLTDKPIVNPPKDLDHLHQRVIEATNEPVTAKVRNLLLLTGDCHEC